MDFQKLLLDVDSALGPDELKASTFLCADILGCNPNSVESFMELFSSLMKQGLLSEEQPQLLVELLITIQQHRLLRNIGLDNQEGSASNSISSYRKLLYELSEYITDGDLKSMKFMLNNLVPRRRLEESFTTLDVLLEMERMDLISDSNLDHLERIFSQICPMLNTKLKQYKTQQAHRPRSSSFPSQSNQVSKSFLRTGSFKHQVSSLTSTNSPNSSDEVGLNCIEGKVLEDPPSQETKETPESEVVIKGLGTYPMTATTRGICVILNNKDFSESGASLKDRAGTTFDEKSLEKVFRWLSFDVRIYRDCKSHEMMSAIKKISEEDHSQMDCLVCCVLSHGLEGSVYGVDGRTVKIEELMDPFDGHKCSSLVEKPKIFFIQACQGTQDQRGVTIKHRKEEEEDGICSDAKVTETIPPRADFLVGMATVPSYVSYRDKSSGTWYIQSLCQNLTKFVPRKVDLISILTQVNADVSEKNYGWKKQMPQPAYSLRKRVIFPIPKIPSPTF